MKVSLRVSEKPVMTAITALAGGRPLGPIDTRHARFKTTLQECKNRWLSAPISPKMRSVKLRNALQ